MEDLDTAGDDAVTHLPRAGGISAWRQIVDHLTAEIRAGHFPSGAQLPTESALATRFGVNRHTVRRALAVLAADGLVRATQGRGTFVEAPPLAYPIGPRTRFSEIVSRGGRDPGGVFLAATSETAPPSVAAALRLSGRSRVLRLEIVRSADGAPISTSTSYLPLPRFEGLDALLSTARGLSSAFADYDVADYRRAETRVAARLASAEEAARLELAAGRVVLVVDSVNVDRAGTPIQVTTALFAADRVEIVVES